tara:strand:- start:1822 stop:2352 length:531 start_codon:yes stop_codon:yes gene_type:complete
MAKISNTSAYPNITTLDSADYLILTDAENQLKTKSCTLGDLQELFGVDTLVTSTTVNSASLLTLNTTPAVLVPAVDGSVLDVISVMCYLDAGSQVYDFAGSLSLDIGAVSIGSVANGSINKATDTVIKAEVPNSNSEEIAQKTGLTITCSAGNPTQGNGVVYFNVYYRVLKVDSSF